MLSKTGHKVQAKGLADAQEAVAFRKCRFWILSILTCQQILIDLQSGIQHFIKDLLCSPIWLFSLAFIVTWGPLWVLTPEVALVVAEEEGNLNPALERHLPPLCKEWYLHGLPASPDTPWRLLQCHEACRRTWCPAHHCTFQRCSEKRTVLYSSVLLSHPISSYLVATLPSLLWRQVARPAEILWHNVSHLNSKLLTEDPQHLFEKNSDPCPAEKLGDKRTKAPDGFSGYTLKLQPSFASKHALAVVPTFGAKDSSVSCKTSLCSYFRSPRNWDISNLAITEMTCTV